MKRKITLFLTALLCMAGMNAWALEKTDGVYQISTAQDLADFATLVNGGEADANAVLLNDIDYTTGFVQIGNPSYKGIFDGQGHTVTVALEGTSEKGVDAALFYNVLGIVKNLGVSGTISSPLDNVASIAFHLYGWVDHCFSDATITSTKTGSCSSAGIVGQCYQGAAITNCLFAGKFTSETATNFAGIMGWSDGTNTVANCLVVAEAEGTACGNSSCAIARNLSRADNCYYLYNAEANFTEPTFQEDRQLVGSRATVEDELKSGAIAYLLGWGQELGVDAMPSPVSTKKVYPLGNCTEPTGYTNDPTSSTHAYDGYKCAVCGAYKPDFMTPVNGVYQIGTAEQLAWFALYVNATHSDANAVLTADIDMSSITDYAMIGTSGKISYYSMYRGTFDGQGHKISNLNVSLPSADNVGFFGSVGPGAVVKNLFTDETCSFYGRTHIGGIMGQAYGVGAGAPVKMLNLGSAAKLAAVPTADGGSSDAGVGGITGNCAGGIKGEITNCWFEGELSGTSCGFISAWCGNNQFTLTSCWSVSKSEAASVISRTGGTVTLNNCFAMKGTQGTIITDEDVASGALCYGLNEGIENPAWHQTLGTDAKPTLQGTDLVYKVGTKNCDGSDGDGFGYSNEDKGFTQLPHQIDPATGLCSVCGQLPEDEDGWYNIPTMDAFLAFAEMSKTDPKMKVRLTADLDFTGIDDSWAPIGTTSKRYTGTFDGQGHKISNMVLNQPEKNDYGMFKTGANVVLKNFYLDSTCSITGGQKVGIIGNHDGAGALFENIGSAAHVDGEGENVSGLLGGAWAANGTVTINSCWMVGEIDTRGPYNPANCGIFAGWTNTGTFVFNDCWAIAIVPNSTNESKYFARQGKNMTLNNCYSLFGSQVHPIPGYEDAADIQKIPATDRAALYEQVRQELATGALAWAVNGDQQTIKWYQNIGEDETPVPWTDHKRVYVEGDVLCNGRPIGNVTYTNTPNENQPTHQFEHGFCQNCGTIDLNYKQPVDGFYELADALDVLWFSTLVNNGNKTANARLTEDIDMLDVNDRFQPIGASPATYGGTFDGDFHTVKNFKINREKDDTGFIGTAISGMTLKNIVFDEGTDIIGGKFVGIVGGSLSGQTGNIYLTNIGNEGKVTATVGENAGGIIGCNHGSAALYQITNCYTTGTIEATKEAGAIAGWMGSSGGKISGCWTSAEVINYQKEELYMYRYGGSSLSASRNYATVGNQGTIVAADMLESGELTWQLNGNSFLDATWFQTIGQDYHPVFQPDHGLVYKIGEVLGDVQDEGTYLNFRSMMIEHETAFAEDENTIADQALLDQYLTTVQSWENIETLDEFLTAYRQSLTETDAIKASQKAYQAYIDACEFAINYLKENEFTSEMRTELENYLNNNEAASADYPNGTYQYVVEHHELNDEQIAAETDFVNSLLQKTIATNIIPGTEITVTLANYDFKDGLNGWEVESSNGGMATGGEKSIMNIARGLNTTFTISQTLTGVPNGIYMFTTNGFSRAGSDMYSQLYSGQLFLNGNMNFFMTQSEDVISKDDAVDGENCHLTGSSVDTEFFLEDVEGWVPDFMVGCSYAYNAGRYLNYTAVEVTDSTLTVGVRNPGTGLANDWVPFGNVRVFYLGTAEQGSENIDKVLAGYVARAEIIRDFVSLDTDEYMQYPNMSEDLKDQIEAAIAEAEAEATAEQKMQLINKFSQLFQEVYTCRKAYVEMFAAMEDLESKSTAYYVNHLITDDEYSAAFAKTDVARVAYQEGTVDAAGAQAITEELKNFQIGPKKDENGVYQITTPSDLAIFALIVNSGEYAADAVLTADLDMSSVEKFIPIGWNMDTDNGNKDPDKASANTTGALYRGHFDGQGHRISNLVVNYPGSIGVGLFGDITNPAHIENFVLDATCEIHGSDRAGVIGRADASGRSGDARIVTINNIGNEGKVYADTAPAGILGNANNGSLAMISDCYSSGLITMETESSIGTSDHNAALICGWLANLGAKITNCWSTAEITNYQSVDRALCRVGGDNNEFRNNYSTFATQANVVAPEAFESGEVTYKLNGGATDASVIWTQTIGQDLHPVFYTSQIVFFIDGEYKNTGETAIKQVEAKLGDIVNVFDAQGRMIRTNVSAAEALKGMSRGMYILKGQSKSVKVLVK